LLRAHFYVFQAWSRRIYSLLSNKKKKKKNNKKKKTKKSKKRRIIIRRSWQSVSLFVADSSFFFAGIAGVMQLMFPSY
jgi:hypothetical protein